jgi:hypothetical protein
MAPEHTWPALQAQVRPRLGVMSAAVTVRYDVEMLSRRGLIDVLAHLAAPLTPFTLEGVPEGDALLLDWLERRSREQFERILDDAVEAFIDIVTHPPAPREYIPPSRNEDSFRAELLGLAECYSRTPHALRIVGGIELALVVPAHRLWAIDVLGRLTVPAALLRLRALTTTSGLTTEEKLRLVDAIGEVGGGDARALLTELRERYAEAEVRSEIDVLLTQLGAC